MADELELIEGLIKDFGEHKAKSVKQIEQVTKEVTERVDKATEDIRADNEKWKKELLEKVEQINKEMAEKGASIKQAQDDLAEFKAKKGRIGLGAADGVESTYQILKQAFAENAQKIMEQATEPKADFRFKVKDAGNMTAANNLTGNVVATYGQSPAVRGRRKLHFRDLVQIINSATGLWKFYRQDTPPGEGSFGFQTTHGNLKNQLDYDFTEVSVNVDYLAGFVRIAKQMLQDLPFMQSYVNTELIEDYLRKESNSFFGTLYSAATGPNTTSGANAAEKIIDVVAAIEENDYDVNGIVVTGAVWASILKTSKGTAYGVPGGVTISPNGDVLFMGIPLYKTTSSNIGNNRILLGDWTKAAIIQTEGLNISMSEHDSDNFQRNLVSVKAEARVALAVLRPDAFSYFSA